jgi:hypothetical protein
MLDRMKSVMASGLIIFLLLLLVSYTQTRDEQSARATDCKGSVSR